MGWEQHPCLSQCRIERPPRLPSQKKTLTPAVSFLTFLWFICICIVCSFDCLLVCLFFVFHCLCLYFIGRVPIGLAPRKGLSSATFLRPKRVPKTKKKSLHLKFQTLRKCSMFHCLFFLLVDCLSLCFFVSLFVCLFVRSFCLFVFVCMCMCTCTCMCMCVYVCLSVCMYVCMYVCNV